MDLRALLSEPENAALPAVVIALVYATRRSGGSYFRSPPGKRLLPLLPLLFGLGLALLGIGTAGPWRERVLFGLLAGFVASGGFAFLRTTVFGRGLADELERPSDPPADPGAAQAGPPATAPVDAEPPASAARALTEKAPPG